MVAQVRLSDPVCYGLGLAGEQDLDVGLATGLLNLHPDGLGHILDACGDLGGLGGDQSPHLDADRLLPAGDLIDHAGPHRIGLHEAVGPLVHHRRRRGLHR